MMGTVFKRTSTKPLPVGAELFVRKGERCARWKTAKGKTKTASVVTPTEGEVRGAGTNCRRDSDLHGEIPRWGGACAHGRNWLP